MLQFLNALFSYILHTTYYMLHATCYISETCSSHGKMSLGASLVCIGIYSVLLLYTILCPGE